MPFGMSDIDSNLSQAWKPYTPTITGSVTSPTLSTVKTLKGSYIAVGKSLFITFNYYAASTTGAAIGSGAYLFSLPDGYTIDTTVADLPATLTSVPNDFCGADKMTLGIGVASNTNGVCAGNVIAATSTKLALFNTVHSVVVSGNGQGNSLVGSGLFGVAYANCSFKFTAVVPIL